MSYAFRALEKRHLPLLKRWIAQPHWREWWGKGDIDDEVAAIEADMESDHFEPMIVELGGKPLAYVQTYDPHLEDGHPYQDQPFGTLGVDISIGDFDMLGQGHGSAILEALAEMLFDEGVPRLVIDPDPANARAIRAYEKAGFVVFDTRTSIYGPALMMALDNPEFNLMEKQYAD
jgi:aminoglycoside 6'-N-acetyltransferase